MAHQLIMCATLHTCTSRYAKHCAYGQKGTSVMFSVNLSLNASSFMTLSLSPDRLGTAAQEEITGVEPTALKRHV